MTEKKPTLTFFCELPSEKLQALFADRKIIPQLRRLGANISLGLPDFSPERAAVVKKLTHERVPVTAWLLLPKEQGYWTSLDTVAETIRCYQQFKEWSAKNKLQWAAIGLDIEPRRDRKLFGSQWKAELPDLAARLFAERKYQARETDLRGLITQIRLDGYAVETYNFPFVSDERLAGSNVIAKTLGTPALDADREVLMLYSSFFAKHGDAILWSYAQQAQAVGLGSTGGGVELEDGEPLRALSWPELRRDLLIASHFSQHLYLFSLEGCIEHGYLDWLESFDWNWPVEMPNRTGKGVNAVRGALQGLLWASAHPTAILFSVLVLNALLRRKSH